MATQLTPEQLNTVRKFFPTYDTLPDLLKAAEFAKFLGIKTGTLAKDRCTKKRFAHVGGTPVLYPKSELARHIAENFVDAA
jgi:hypothetical protein